jgi:hypothetical protein
LSGHLLCTVSPETFKSAADGRRASDASGSSSPSVVDALLRPETLISVVLIAFLVTICMASGGTHPPFLSQVEHAAMLVTIVALVVQILLPLVLPASKSSAGQAANNAQTLPPVAVKVCWCSDGLRMAHSCCL